MYEQKSNISFAKDWVFLLGGVNFYITNQIIMHSVIVVILDHFENLQHNHDNISHKNVNSFKSIVFN